VLLRDSIALELVTEIARPHHGLLASKIGKKAFTNPGLFNAAATVADCTAALIPALG
jgi:hypothetical protein